MRKRLKQTSNTSLIFFFSFFLKHFQYTTTCPNKSILANNVAYKNNISILSLQLTKFSQTSLYLRTSSWSSWFNFVCPCDIIWTNQSILIQTTDSSDHHALWVRPSLKIYKTTGRFSRNTSNIWTLCHLERTQTSVIISYQITTR